MLGTTEYRTFPRRNVFGKVKGDPVKGLLVLEVPLGTADPGGGEDGYGGLIEDAVLAPNLCILVPILRSHIEIAYAAATPIR
jgi:hypothetical protein